jgi:hypothetical protein
MKTIFNSDVDIDVGDRDGVLELLKYTPAAMRNVTPIRRHNTGIYITDIPLDPVNNIAALDYVEAEKRGYVKLDLLNVWIYKLIKDENHLVSLMREPQWRLLRDQEYFEKIIHIGNHYETLLKMPEHLDSIPRMAMFLSIMRPGKRHLIGKTWREIAETVWMKEEGGYSFKKSHAIAYAQMVVVHMNLLEENPAAFVVAE